METTIKKKIHTGSTGICYLLKNGDVLKFFNKSLDLLEINRFKYFSLYKNNGFNFPYDFAFDKKSFYGYISSFVDGKRIESIIPKTNINDLIDSLSDFENNIIDLSNSKIRIRNLNINNIFYNNKKITVLDPFYYSVALSESKEDLLTKNLNYYREQVLTSIIKNLDNDNLDKLIYRIMMYKENGATTSQILFDIKKYFDRYYSDNFETINDINKIKRK